MTDTLCQPWIAVLGLMQDPEYRQHVVQVALTHLDSASSDLRRFARNVFGQHLVIPGFRSFGTVPQSVAQRHVIHEMENIPPVTEAVICLWAEASAGIVEEVRGLAADAGWSLPQDWNWGKGRTGFVDLSMVDSQKHLFDSIADEYEGLHRNDLLLGLLWVSNGLTQQTAPDNEADVADPSSEEAPAASAPALTTPADAAYAVLVDENEAVAPAYPAEPDCGELEQTEEGVPSNREWTLEALISELRCRADEWKAALATTQELARGLLDAAELGDLAETGVCMDRIGEALRKWQCCNENLASSIETTLLRVRRDLEMRPDLLDTGSQGWLEELGTEQPVQASDSLTEILTEVQRYDDEKSGLRATLSSQAQGLARVRSELALWTPEFPTETATYEQHEFPADVTLQDLKSALQEIAKRQAELGRQLAVLRDSAISRILAVSTSLRNDETFEQSTLIWKDWTLQKVTGNALAELGSEALRAVEQALNEVMSQHIAEARAGDLALIASELAVSWDPQRFPNLVEAIAQEKRDVESVLAIVTTRAVHAWEGTQSFSADVVDSFLRGVSQIAGTLGVAGLLNLGMSALLQSWVADDDLAQAKLSLYLIAAKYTGAYRLPGELLFSVATDWPLKGTPGWASLWESALYDAALPSLIEEGQDEALDDLDEARERVEQLFIREGYKPIGLRSIQSARHLKMLLQELLPRFEKWWLSLNALDRGIRSARESHEFGRLQKQLGQEVTAMKAELNPSNLEELYEHARYESGTEDFQPFHRRTSLRALATYEEALRLYTDALETYLARQARSGVALTTASLLAELGSYRGLQPIGQEVLTQLRQSSDVDKPEWDPEAANLELSQHILELLLRQGTYAQRLPRTVGYLASSAFQWETLLEPLLADLAEPLEAEAAAQALIECDAPDQALFLTQQISLKQQKTAQAARARLESEFVQCQRELLAVGSPFEDLATDRHLGRWPYVIRIMTVRLQAARAEQAADAERTQRQVGDLLRRINEMEMRLFETQEEPPVVTREQAERILDLCRQAARKNLLLGEIEDYLREFDFRLSHQSWPIQELRVTVERLEAAVKGEQHPSGGLPSVEGVRDLLRSGDYAALGLSEAMMASISVATRCDLLDDWLEVRDLAWAPGTKPNAAQRQKLRHLYASFAQTLAMAQVKSPSGEPVVFDDEIVAAHWELRYPKVAGLKRNCVLIGLPGNPPSPQYLKTLAETIDDREWLTYTFVFLFAPGIGPEQRRRLQQIYAGRPLILVDEPVLLDMTLAERRSRSPLGVLRPMMLNSLGTDKVDVFEINQAVNAELGIFVGRESLIDRIVSSGGNYALYGGRRIGKSSVLRDIEKRLERQANIVVSTSCEGEEKSDDDAVAFRLGRHPALSILAQPVNTVGDLKSALQAYLDRNPDARFLITLDEIDRYIRANPDRHVLIEALRALSEQFGNRFRVVVAGFMDLYDCLQGRGPYSPSSDPWQRMLNDPGPLGNLQAASAEMIVREGFLNILGWDFGNRATARWIVERTGGHPAFVQDYCLKLQDLVAHRKDSIVQLRDVDENLADDSPDASFISYVRKTLNMNLEIDSIDGIVAQYVILYLSAESSEKQGFTLDEAREIAASSHVVIPEEILRRALERLKVTSVVQEPSAGVYEFSVPDYPGILHRLGDTMHLERIEHALQSHLGAMTDERD